MSISPVADDLGHDERFILAIIFDRLSRADAAHAAGFDPLLAGDMLRAPRVAAGARALAAAVHEAALEQEQEDRADRRLRGKPVRPPAPVLADMRPMVPVARRKAPVPPR